MNVSNFDLLLLFPYFEDAARMCAAGGLLNPRCEQPGLGLGLGTGDDAFDVWEGSEGLGEHS